MGLRGPTKEPTALKLLKGNPGKRALNDREPQPGAGRPYCPAHIRSDKVAHREWRRLSPILQRMRVLTEADYITLGNLCTAYSAMIAAQEQITALNAKNSVAGLVVVIGKKKTTKRQKDGSEVTTESPGFMQISPLLSIVQNSIITITKLCREFGLTPSARSSIQIEGTQEKNLPGSTLNGNWRCGS